MAIREQGGEQPLDDGVLTDDPARNRGLERFARLAQTFKKRHIPLVRAGCRRCFGFH